MDIILKAKVKIIEIKNKNTTLVKDFKVKEGDILRIEYNSKHAMEGHSAHIQVINESTNAIKTTYLQKLRDQLNRNFIFDQII